MDLFTKGWQCPKCGAVMSPTTSVCVNCKGTSEITAETPYTVNDYTPEDVRKMSRSEVRANCVGILKSMEKWK